MKKLIAPSLVAVLLISLLVVPAGSGCSPRGMAFLAGAVIATVAVANAVDHVTRAERDCCERSVYYDGREVWDCCGRWEYYDEQMGEWYYYEEVPPELRVHHEHHYYYDNDGQYYYN